MADRTSYNKIISQFSAEDRGAIQLLKNLQREYEALAAKQTNLRQAAMNVATGVDTSGASVTDFTNKARGLDQSLNALNSQIAAIPPHVKSAAAGLDANGRSLANYTNGVKQAAHHTGGLYSQIAGSGPPLQNFARGLLSASANIPLMTGGMVAAGIVLADFTQTALRNFAELEQAIADISAIKPEIDTDLLFNQLSALQTVIPATSKELAASYYAITQSIDLSAEQTLALTQKITQGAIAANADTAQWSQVVVGSMHQLGLSLGDVDHLMDVLITTINRGDITGQELAAGWGRLVTAGTAVGATLEEIAGMAVAVSKSAAPAAEDLNNLTNAYQKLATDEAAERMKALGVNIADASGDIRPMVDVLTDLSIRLDEIGRQQGGAARAQALQNIFPDQQARAAINELMKRIPLITSATREATDATNVWGQAHATRIDTAAQKTQLFENRVRNLQEHIGNVVNPVRLLGAASDGLEGSQDKLQKSWQSQVVMLARLNPLLAQLSDYVMQSTGVTGALALQQENLDNYFEDTADSISRVTQYYQTSGEIAEDAFNRQQRAAELFFTATQQGTRNVEVGLGSLQDTVARMETANTRDYNDLRDNAVAALKKVDEQIVIHERELAGLLTATSGNMGSAGDEWERFAIRAANAAARARGAKEQIEGALEGLESQEAQISRTIRDETEQRALDAALDEARKAAGLIDQTRAEKEAADARERLLNAQRAFEQQQQSTAATKRLKEAQDALAASTAKNKDELQKLKDVRDSMEDAEKWEIEALGIARVTSELESLRTTATKALDALDNSARSLRTELEQLNEAAQIFLGPFRERVTAAEVALVNLRNEVEEVNESLERQATALRRQMREIQNEERVVLGAFDNLIRETRDTLSDMAREHETQMRPLNDAIYDQSQLVSRLDAEVRKVADAYDQRLNPLQKELNELNREAERIDAGRRLNEQRVSIENLAASLSRLTPGTAAYVETQRRLREAQQDLKIDQRRGELEEEIATIEDQKQVAVDAAQARADAARQTLESLQEEARQLERNYELERRMYEDRLAGLERSRELASRVFEEQRAQVQGEIDKLQERQERYNEWARLREKEAEKAVADAQLLLKSMEAVAQSYITDLETQIRMIDGLRTSTNLYYNDLIGKKEAEIGQLKIAELAIKARYGTERDEIDLTIKAVQTSAEEKEAAGKREVDAIQRSIDKLKEQWAWQDAINRLYQSGAPLPPGSQPSPGTQPPAPPRYQPPPPPTPGPGPHGMPTREPTLPFGKTTGWSDWYTQTSAPAASQSGYAYESMSAYAPSGGNGQTVIINAPINMPIHPKGMTTQRDIREIRRATSQAVAQQQQMLGVRR